MWLINTMWSFTATLTTFRCRYTVSETTQCLPSFVLVTALPTSATGWQQIVCRWIPPRPSCCGPALNTTSRRWVVMLLPCSLAQILRQPAIMYEYSGWPFRRTWPLRSMFRKPVQLVSTGCANFVASGGRLTKNRQQLLCMLLWRHGLINAMLSTQLLQRRSCNDYSTPPPE